MCISYDKKYQKRGNKKIYHRRKYFTIQYSSKRKIFKLFDFESCQQGTKNRRSDQIFYHSFYKFSYFGRNKKSDSDTEDIVLWKKGHKFLEHFLS